MTVPTHLAATVAEAERDNLSKDEYVQLLADLIVARALPAKFEDDAKRFIDDGWLSPAGDVLRRSYEPDYF